jgi:hypothetical protein
MTLFTRTSAAVAELEAAFASASADPAPPSKAVADGWASSLAALSPSVAKMRATALESDPEKQLYAPAMRDKVLDLVARLEAAQAAFAPLQARPFRGRRRGAEGTTLLSSGHLGLRADAGGTTRRAGASGAGGGCRCGGGGGGGARCGGGCRTRAVRSSGVDTTFTLLTCIAPAALLPRRARRRRLLRASVPQQPRPQRTQRPLPPQRQRTPPASAQPMKRASPPLPPPRKLPRTRLPPKQLLRWPLPRQQPPKRPKPTSRSLPRSPPAWSAAAPPWPRSLPQLLLRQRHSALSSSCVAAGQSCARSCLAPLRRTARPCWWTSRRPGAARAAWCARRWTSSRRNGPELPS